MVFETTIRWKFHWQHWKEYGTSLQVIVTQKDKPQCSENSDNNIAAQQRCTDQRNSVNWAQKRAVFELVFGAVSGSAGGNFSNN